MEAFLDTAIVFGLFVLRFIVPLVITVGAGYVLVRLDKRWQAAAEAERLAWIEAEEAGQPARPQPAMPGIFPLLRAPCWVQKGCDPAKRATCPAYLHPTEPCWLARLEAEGALPTPCLTCTLFAYDVGADSVLLPEITRTPALTQPVARD